MRKITKKISVVAVSFTFIFMLTMASPKVVEASTTDLQVRIQELMLQIRQLQNIVTQLQNQLNQLRANRPDNQSMDSESSQLSVSSVRPSQTYSHSLNTLIQRYNNAVDRLETSVQFDSEEVQNIRSMLSRARQDIYQTIEAENNSNDRSARNLLRDAESVVRSAERDINSLLRWLPPRAFAIRAAGTEQLIYEIEVYMKDFVAVDQETAESAIETLREQIRALENGYRANDSRVISERMRDITRQQGDLRRLLANQRFYRDISWSLRLAVTDFAIAVGDYRVVYGRLTPDQRRQVEQIKGRAETSITEIRELEMEERQLRDEIRSITDRIERRDANRTVQEMRSQINDKVNHLRTMKQEVDTVIFDVANEYFERVCFFSGNTAKLDTTVSGVEYSITLLEGATFRCNANQLSVRSLDAELNQQGDSCQILRGVTFPHGTIASIDAGTTIPLEQGYIPSGTTIYQCKNGQVEILEDYGELDDRD